MLRKFGTGVVALCMAAGFSMVACSDDDSGDDCGNGIIEGSEICDSADLGGRTCSDEGFIGGTLSCNATCDGYDTSQCSNTVCGDDVQEGTEDCDGADLNNTTCVDRGFDGGALDCTGTCTFDETGCTMDCTNDCPAEDDTRCVGEVLGICTVGADGCLDWVDTDCTATSQICDDSGVTALCVDECTSDCPAIGVTECADASTLNTCEDGGDGCIYWTPTTCTGGYCGGDPAECLTSGSGRACDDVYDLDGRTFPHTLPGLWDTGAYVFQGSCQNGGNPVYLSYTVQGSNPEGLFFEIQNGGLNWPEISAWTTTEATGFCDGALMTEIGCSTGSSTFQSLTLDGSGISQGDVIYFLIGGDGPTYPLSDPDVSVLEQICGDGAIVGNEVCDDGNLITGDGCDADCQVETAWECTGEPSTCTYTCGNGTIDATANEQCDDGNTTAGDGCDADCQVETAWDCTGEPSTCTYTCGSGTIDATTYEQCDDGNTTAGDGCDADCQVESGYYCSGEPSTCVTATTLLTEDFSTWPPTGWTIEDGGTTTDTWMQCDVGMSCDRGEFDGANGAVGPYALVDSDEAGSGVTLAEGLVSPAINCTAYAGVALSFDHNFQKYSTDPDLGLVEVSTDGGTNWTQVALYDADTSTDGEYVTLDISAVAGNQASVTIRFYYTGEFDWYWMVDSIQVLGF